MAKVIDLSALDSTQGFIIQGDGIHDNAGYSVSSAGDVNGDGIADLIVGARMADGSGAGTGAAYVIYGQQSATNLDLATLTSARGFKIDGATADQVARLP